MSPKFWKTKIKCQDLAEQLAPRFAKQILRSFEEEKKEMGEHSWTIEAGQSNTEIVVFREWALFEIAAYLNGCRSSMKQDAIHFEFVRRFIVTCGREFVEQRIFDDLSAYLELAQDRTSKYMSIFRDNDPDEAMQNVAVDFLSQLQCNTDNIASRMVLAGMFINVSALTKTMFDNIGKEFRLVA